MTKKELRQSVRLWKTEHKEQFRAWSLEICRRVANSAEWKQAKTVLLYYALPDEPCLQILLDEGLRLQKRILLPVVVGDDLVLKEYQGTASLREGAFHILEPAGEIFPEAHYDEIDLVLVPGMAFDTSGHRLGRGRGYYDRLLPRLPRARKLGICFPFQYLDCIPHESHDIPMDGIVVPNEKL